MSGGGCRLCGRGGRGVIVEPPCSIQHADRLGCKEVEETAREIEASGGAAWAL